MIESELDREIPQESLRKRWHTHISKFLCILLISELSRSWTKAFTCWIGLVLKLLETTSIPIMLVNQYYLKQCIWWKVGFINSIISPINFNEMRFLLAKEPLKQELSYQVTMLVLPIAWKTPVVAFCIKTACRKKMKVLHLFKGSF